MAASKGFFSAGLLVLLVAAYIAIDPFRLSPVADIQGFEAKHVELPPLGDTLRFPRDPNNRLQNRSHVHFITQVMGPESLAFDPSGAGPYTGIADGRIMRWVPDGNGEMQGSWEEFATLYPKGSEDCQPQFPPVVNLQKEHICGRPLGIHFMPGTGELYIADAYHGLCKVGPDGGEATLVASEAAGIPFGFTNDVEISSEGIIYFTDSSIKYRRRQFMLAALSGDDSGRLLSYNPAKNEVKVLCSGIQFPNGLAISKDESFLVIAQTTPCRLSRFWLKGEKSGTLETFVQLPGPPDNVRVNDAGEFWVALHCRQTPLVWVFFSYPWLRYALLKLPIPMKYFYPIFLGGKPHAMVIRIDSSGQDVLEVLEDKDGDTVKLVSEVEERGNQLWMGSVLMPHIAVYTR